jgi:TPR repeat protein
LAQEQEVNLDYNEVLKLAEQGDAKAQYDLGKMYSDGKEVKQDYKEAVKWY